MSYGLKYWNEFKNYYDETIRIEILGNGYSGSELEIKTGATPLIISYPGDDTNLYNPILGSQAKITLLSESDFQFVDLHNSDARAHRVDIYKESVLDWTGWVLPDLFTEPYIAPPYYVEVTARCGLGELKEAEMPTEVNQLRRESGWVVEAKTRSDLFSIIANALLSIETTVYLNEAINVYSSVSDTINDSPIANTTINVSAYEGKTIYEAISDMLITFGARLYQMNGEWWIVRAKEAGETLSVRRWTLTSDGVNGFTTDDTKITTFQIGRPAGSQIVNESPQLDINPAWKKFTWNQDLGKYESFILNHTFDEWEEYPITVNNTSWKIKTWEESYIGFLRRFILTDGQKFGQFSTGDRNKYIKQTILNVKANSNQQISFKILFNILSVNTAIESAGFSFVIKVGSYYLKINSSDEFEWTTDSSQIVVSQVEPIYLGGRWNINGDTNTDWKTYEFITDSFPVDGDMEITIYGNVVLASEDVRLRLKEFSAIFLDSNGVEYSDNLETEITVNENNIYTPDTIEVVGGDLPDIINDVLIWENGYRDSDGDATHVWHERGSSLEIPLLDLIGKDYSQIYKLPQFKLAVPILSQSIQFDSCIVDYQVLPKKYICVSSEIDYQTCIHRGTYVEFSSWEESNWILETGYWNDNGIWIDGETWRDDDTDVIEYNFTTKGAKLISEIQSGDKIETLPTYGSYYYDYMVDDVILVLAAPYSVVNDSFYYVVSPLAYGNYTVSFDATIDGVLKKIVINVEI